MDPEEALRQKIDQLAQGQRLDLIVTIPAQGGAFPIFAQVEAARMRTGIVLATAGAAVLKLADLAEADSSNLDVSFDAMLRAVQPLPDAAARMEHVMLGEEPGYRFTINGAIHGEAPPIAAKGLNLAGLQGVQQLDLGGWGQLTNFRDEQGATIGGRERANM